MPVIDLLENMPLLKSPNLRLEELALRGIPYGCAASDFPVSLVSQVTLAPIVKRSAWSTESGATYQDEHGNQLSLSEVIANALQFGGTLHLPGGVSFGFEGGRVTSLGIYGEGLEFFRYIKNYQQFAGEFGKPDSVSSEDAHGDLMGYKHYYAKCKKVVIWDEFKRRLVVINFGMKQYAAGDA